MSALDLILLYDYYGDLLTQRQRECFEMRYNQDLSLGEIAGELSISRQAVYDNLSRTEALLKNMEEKTGCVSRDMQLRKALGDIKDLSAQLTDHPDRRVAQIAEQIYSCAANFEE